MNSFLSSSRNFLKESSCHLSWILSKISLGEGIPSEFLQGTLQCEFPVRNSSKNSSRNSFNIFFLQLLQATLLKFPWISSRISSRDSFQKFFTELQQLFHQEFHQGLYLKLLQESLRAPRISPEMLQEHIKIDPSILSKVL